MPFFGTLFNKKTPVTKNTPKKIMANLWLPVI
jgi:hypothetical protein